MTRRFLALTALMLSLSACISTDRTRPASANFTESVYTNAVNLNTASAEELQRIPHIGEKLASKIIEHREVRGPFRRVEHLMLIQGISDKRFRKIRPLVRVE
jgi:competence protein ComEA